MTPSVRHFLVLAVAAFFSVLGIRGAFAAGAEKAPPAPTTPDRAAVEFLLASATKEFRAPGSMRPLAIRRARVGYFADAGPGRYLLCGSFQSAESKGAEWIRFATIKTSDYEEWLGGVAESLCSSKKVKWYTDDHAAALMQRVRD